MSPFHIASAVVALSFCLVTSALHAETIKPIGPLTADFGYATGINSAGQVALGTFGADPETPINRALRYDPSPLSPSGGILRDLGTLPGGVSAYANGISPSGQVVGESETSVAGESHAFRYDGTPGAGGVMLDLGTLGGTNAAAIASNAHNQTVGFSFTPNADQHAFLYTGTPGAGGSMRDLGTLGGDNSTAFAINDAGQITGDSALTPGSGITHAYRYDSTSPTTGIMRDLGLTGDFRISNGIGINASGQVVGNLNFGTVAFAHGFRYDGTPGIDGHMTDLGNPLGGENSSAYSINDAGFIVGDAQLPNEDSRAVLWTPDGTGINLDAWLDVTNPALGQDWTLLSASAINNDGLITGYGEYTGPGAPPTPNYIAFLLDAHAIVPEPSSLAPAALLSMLVLRRKRRSQA